MSAGNRHDRGRVLGSLLGRRATHHLMGCDTVATVYFVEVPRGRGSQKTSHESGRRCTIMVDAQTEVPPMSVAKLNDVLHFQRTKCDAADQRDDSDAALLERFLAQHEQAALGILVQRHGPMVLGVCRRILADSHAAEDAFQATFVVLIRRAGSNRKPASLASWLHGVARHVAGRAKARAKAGQDRERRVVAMAQQEPLDELTWQELRGILDEEIGRLPERCRGPVVLCYLQGKSYDEAARELGCPKSSMASRLGRARALLPGQLVRRGIILTAAAWPRAAPIPPFSVEPHLCGPAGQERNGQRKSARSSVGRPGRRCSQGRPGALGLCPSWGAVA
jgi:RNA polymerase sigma factor (sigma-70 family)